MRKKKTLATEEKQVLDSLAWLYENDPTRAVQTVRAAMPGAFRLKKPFQNEAAHIEPLKIALRRNSENDVSTLCENQASFPKDTIVTVSVNGGSEAFTSTKDTTVTASVNGGSEAFTSTKDTTVTASVNGGSEEFTSPKNSTCERLTVSDKVGGTGERGIEDVIVLQFAKAWNSMLV